MMINGSGADTFKLTNDQIISLNIINCAGEYYAEEIN